MVSQELGYKRTITDKEYFEWFAKTLGENVGIMHRNGWTHRYLSSHNVTLDCRIVDLDSVGYDLSERERGCKPGERYDCRSYRSSRPWRCILWERT